MTALLFYFVGNSDIQLNGKRIDNFREKTKELCEKIKENLNDEKPIIRNNGFKIENDLIELPIFISYLEYLKDELTDLKIYFIYTNQEPRHDKDTLYAYEILKLYTEKKHKNVKIEEICINKDPSNWDEMGLFFKDKARELQDELEVSLKNYVSISPGTPASYVSLAMNLLDYDVKFISSSQQSGKSVAKEVVIFNKIKKENALEKIKILLDSYRYKNAYNFIQKSPLRYLKDIKDLIKSMNYCLNDDFRNAMDEFKSLPEKIQTDFKNYGEFISRICRNNELIKFKDLYWKIKMAAECEQYVEFIALIFNLRENLAHYLFKEVIGKAPLQCKEYIESNADLKREFENQKLNYEKPSIPVIEKVLNFEMGKINKENPNYDKIDSFLSFSKYLNEPKYIEDGEISLSKLRNEGRFAHGITATNEEILNKFGGVKNIMEEVANPLKKIFGEDVGLDENIYDVINENIIKYIGEAVNG